MKRSFFVISCILIITLMSCGTSRKSELDSVKKEAPVYSSESSYESAEGKIIRMKSGDVEV